MGEGSMLVKTLLHSYMREAGGPYKKVRSF
jgi:hypothetical protein